MDETGHKQSGIQVPTHQKLNNLYIDIELKRKLYQSPHIIPLLLFVTLYTDYHIKSYRFLVSRDCTISLTQTEAIKLNLYIYKSIKCDYIECSSFIEQLEIICSSQKSLISQFHNEMRHLTSDIEYFAKFLKCVENVFISGSSSKAFPNEVEAFVYQCLISFEASDIFEILKLIDDIQDIYHGHEDSDNIFYNLKSLPLQLKGVNVKHYIKCLIVNLEKKRCIREINIFSKFASSVVVLLPHVKRHVDHLMNMYRKYLGINDENNSNFNLKWENSQFNLLADDRYDSIIKQKLLQSFNEDVNEDNIITIEGSNPPVRTGIPLLKLNGFGSNPQFQLKFEIIQSTFEKVVFTLSQSNISYQRIKSVVSHLHDILYYVLSSNRKTNIEIYLLHLCLCWNAYMETKFYNATNNQQELKPSKHEKVEIIDRPDFSHLKHAILSICNVESAPLTQQRKKRMIERLRILDCFLEFQKILHTFKVIDIKKVDEFTNFASKYPDMEPACRLYRSYCYQSIGYIHPAKQILKCMINAEKIYSQTINNESPSEVVYESYNISIYDRDDTIFSIYCLLLQIDSSVNNLYEMDQLVDHAPEEFKSLNIINDSEQLQFIKELNSLNQAYLSESSIIFETHVLNLTAYYHESNEFLKHQFYRYCSLNNNLISITGQLQSSFEFLCENTNFQDDEEFRITIVDFEILIRNAILYSNILRKIGKEFEAINVISVCVEKCHEFNFNKFLLVLIEQLRFFTKKNSILFAIEELTQFTEQHSSFYCKNL